MKNLNLKMNVGIAAVLLSVAALLTTSCTMYDDFDEDLVEAYIAKHSPAEPESSSSVEESSSSEETVSSSSEKEEDSSSSELSSSSSEGCPESFTDERDGKEYAIEDVFDRNSKTSRCWFAKNLEYKQEFSECYDGDSKKCKTYGRLYSGDQLNNKGKSAACPEGTHIATLDDLQHFVAMTGLKKDCSVEKDGTCEGAAVYMKNKQGWGDGAPYGQSVLGMLPGGSFVEGEYAMLEENGYWWVADESFDAGFGFMVLSVDSEVLTVTDITEEDLEKTYYSIRCVIDF